MSQTTKVSNLRALVGKANEVFVWAVIGADCSAATSQPGEVGIWVVTMKKHLRDQLDALPPLIYCGYRMDPQTNDLYIKL